MSAKSSSIRKSVAAGLLAIATGPAFSTTTDFAPTYCPEPDTAQNADGLSMQDVSFKSGNQPSTYSDGCYGVVGGNITARTGLPPLVWETNQANYKWSHLVGTDANREAYYETLSFVLSGDGFNGEKSGTWTLSWVDLTPGDPLDLPTTLNFIVALKASDRYALYYFDDVLLEAAPYNSGSGTWNITFENHGHQIPGLSHLDIFVGEETVPEPDTLLLTSLGMLGLFAVNRRRLN